MPSPMESTTSEHTNGRLGGTAGFGTMTGGWGNTFGTVATGQSLGLTGQSLGQTGQSNATYQTNGMNGTFG